LQRAGLEYEIISAVDGRSLDLGDATLVDPSLVSGSEFPAGTAGCALSHFHICQRVVEDHRDGALVLEDDVVLPDDLSDLADEVAEHLTGAEVALLEYANSSPGPLRMSMAGSVELGSSRMLALPLDTRQLRNTGAYVITRQACERIIEGLLPIRAHADDWQFYYEEGFVDRIRCVLPRPVSKNPHFESTIGFYSLGNGMKARLAGPFVRHRIPFLHQAILYRRQRIMGRLDRAEVVDMPFVEKPSRLG
jgi:glycosyl transferase family 25